MPHTSGGCKYGDHSVWPVTPCWGPAWFIYLNSPDLFLLSVRLYLSFYTGWVTLSVPSAYISESFCLVAFGSEVPFAISTVGLLPCTQLRQLYHHLYHYHVIISPCVGKKWLSSPSNFVVNFCNPHSLLHTAVPNPIFPDHQSHPHSNCFQPLARASISFLTDHQGSYTVVEQKQSC